MPATRPVLFAKAQGLENLPKSGKIASRSRGRPSELPNAPCIDKARLDPAKS